MIGIQDWPRTDDHFGAAFDDRLHQRFDVACVVLIVGVGVDDDVGAARDGGFEAGHECGGEAAVDRVTHDTVDAELLGDFRGVIGGAVVDDEPFDNVAAGDFAREVRDRVRQ